MNRSITVAIVTRNRAKDLQECLQSLSRQTLVPEKILIVNNDSSDQTHDVIREFPKMLPVEEVVEKKIGYPAVYSRALQEAKTTWVAFIDDDCIADTQWYNELVKATKLFKGYAAIAGSSHNYYPKNIYACTFQFSYEYWRLRSIKNANIIDYRALDSRNIVYNRLLLSKYNIVFDDAFIVGAEDSDFGLQIQSKGLSAVYIQEMKIFHKEPRTMSAYVRKKHAQATALRYLTKKWKIKAPPSDKRKQLELMPRRFLLVTKQLSPLNRLKTFCLVFVDYIFSRCHVYELHSFCSWNELKKVGKLEFSKCSK